MGEKSFDRVDRPYSIDIFFVMVIASRSRRGEIVRSYGGVGALTEPRKRGTE